MRALIFKGIFLADDNPKWVNHFKKIILALIAENI